MKIFSSGDEISLESQLIKKSALPEFKHQKYPEVMGQVLSALEVQLHQALNLSAIYQAQAGLLADSDLVADALRGS